MVVPANGWCLNYGVCLGNAGYNTAVEASCTPFQVLAGYGKCACVFHVESALLVHLSEILRPPIPRRSDNFLRTGGR